MSKSRLIAVLVYIIFSSSLFSLSCTAQGPEKERLIKIETTKGDMIIKLYNETPAHRDNMIKLIQDGFYRDQLFHRVINGFMIQGGDPQSAGAAKGQRLGSGSPGYTVPAEIHEGLIHKKGALAAARQGDQVNPERASNGSQFYLVQGEVLTMEELNMLAQRGGWTPSMEQVEVYTSVGGTPHLDGAYTVFGEVIEGLDVLDSIAASPTDAYDRPLEDVIYSISILE
jgi:cyclophilin family peptidyl-prolyl cis-trans isomerase